ncbi:MAG: argininosuccinate lyase [Candidatus Omnitrophica bacterium]|nr:argininosuccinate lyase [Candidatus Omnitrophota bacterium]
MAKLWGSRFKKKTNSLVEKFSSSIGYDYKLAKYDVLASIAQAQMLGKARIISVRDSARIVQALRVMLKQIEQGSFVFDKKAEDVHTNIQNALKKKIGQVAKKLHTARSRNDLVATDLRMYAKEEIRNQKSKIKYLQLVLVEFAKKNIKVIIPGFTHLQHAQAISLAHQLLAYVEMLERDQQRLSDAYKRCDVLPLGSAALAGTTLPINRNYLAKLLGFSKVSANSIDAVSDRDFVLEILSALSILSMHLSRMAEDFILWASPEFGLLELDESFCTGSSLMPQKRNPDVLELIRANAGTVYGNLLALLTTFKGLPLSYNRDMQLDKPAFFNSLESLSAGLEVFSELVKCCGINSNQALMLSSDELLCATDLVDYLVRKGVAFQEAHKIVGKIVAFTQERKLFLSEIPPEKWKQFSGRFEKDVYGLLNAQASVEAKRSFGGTCLVNIKRELSNWKKRLKK